MGPAQDGDRTAMANLTMKLRSAGVADRRVLAALERVPRRLFLAAQYQQSVDLDRPLPIECGQVTSAPTDIARAVEALEVRPGDKVLEIGTGSGFQTAVLAQLAMRVVSVDRYRTLIDLAEDRLTMLKVDNVTLIAADGLYGFTRHAPYNRIIVNGAMKSVPGALLDQLDENGLLVAPVGEGPTQTLVTLRRQDRTFTRAELRTVRYLPLIEGMAVKL